MIFGILIVKDMTRDERVATYMKLDKKELVAMLMENQRAVDKFIEHSPNNNVTSAVTRDHIMMADLCAACGEAGNTHKPWCIASGERSAVGW